MSDNTATDSLQSTNLPHINLEIGLETHIERGMKNTFLDSGSIALVRLNLVMLVIDERNL